MGKYVNKIFGILLVGLEAYVFLRKEGSETALDDLLSSQYR